MSGEDALDDLALHADAPAVNQANLDEASGLSGVEIFRDD